MSSIDTVETNGKGTQDASPVLLYDLQLQGFLSFGSEYTVVGLGPLNILIGPNGSGKSNLIEAISLFRATASSFQEVIRKGGGVQEWVWKGKPDAHADIELHLRYPHTRMELHHQLHFYTGSQSAVLGYEDIDGSWLGPDQDAVVPLFHSDGDTAFIKPADEKISVQISKYDFNESVLSQRKDPEQYPEISYIAEQYSRIRIYREWQFGRNSVFRMPQRADMRTDRLEEDFSNLGLFLNRLRRNPQAKNAILRHLRDIYEGVDDFDVSVEGGTVQVFFTEGNFTIPATRLSDGTLRYLCLLAILCDPTPPPLICIEEPELGLHPDILPKIADLLVEASQRTQLIVTTHSDILVDAMTERPESVLVCEKRDGQTQINRLSTEDLSVWLKTYRLGELWTRGELGGNRW
jgi:predicted ATPase